MNILTIDTATRVEIVAVKSGDRTADMTGIVDISHSATLFSRIDKALKQIEIDINDIGLIGAGIGPGSFTGIRIAVSTARMLAQIIKAPVVGIKTHHFFASAVEAQIDENILVCFDAKKERVFGGLYRKGKEHLPEIIVEPGDYHIDQLLDYINLNKKTYIIGDAGLKYYDSNIKEKILDNVLIPDFMPSGGKICVLSRYLYDNNIVESGDYNNLFPFYSRRSDAEVKKKLRGKM